MRKSYESGLNVWVQESVVQHAQGIDRRRVVRGAVVGLGGDAPVAAAKVTQGQLAEGVCVRQCSCAATHTNCHLVAAIKVIYECGSGILGFYGVRGTPQSVRVGLGDGYVCLCRAWDTLFGDS